MKMDDLGVPLFLETPKCWKLEDVFSFWTGLSRDPGSPNLRMVMEPKYIAEVIVHPNHPLTFGDWTLLG